MLYRILAFGVPHLCQLQKCGKQTDRLKPKRRITESIKYITKYYSGIVVKSVSNFSFKCSVYVDILMNQSQNSQQMSITSVIHIQYLLFMLKRIWTQLLSIKLLYWHFPDCTLTPFPLQDAEASMHGAPFWDWCTSKRGCAVEYAGLNIPVYKDIHRYAQICALRDLQEHCLNT